MRSCLRKARRWGEWLRGRIVTWLSQSELFHVTDLKRHHSMIVRGPAIGYSLLAVGITKPGSGPFGSAGEDG